MSPRKGNDLQRRLISKGLIVSESLSDGTRKWKVLCLTDKGRELLGLPEEGKRSGGIQHQFWVEKVSAEMKARGYEIQKEFPIGDGKTIDLVATKNGRRVAIEVETGSSDALGNIRKCLSADFDTVFCLAIGVELTDKVRKEVANFKTGKSKIEVMEVGDTSARGDFFQN